MQADLSLNNQMAYRFFLFVNTSSGGNDGALLLQQQVERIQFILNSQNEHSSQLRCSVYIFNMKTNCQQGFKMLKLESQNQSFKCYAIVCGGDGTVMWVVNQMVNYSINVASVPIAVIPLGTGNDFSRQLGWGYQVSGLLSNGFKNLKNLIRKWLQAKQQYFDIWDIEAEVYENGKFQKVQNSNNQLVEGKYFNKTFCNYFSFGIDGKIGYGFDMHRKKSRIGNLVTYACMGLVKTLTKTKNLNQLLDSFQYKNNKKLQKKSTISTISQNFQDSKQSVIVKASSFSQSSAMEKQLIFQKNYYNILMLNINSYTGGVKNIWQNAKSGFIKKNKQTITDQQYEEPSTGDGKIQVVSFGSSFGIAIQRMIGGFSKKVIQGQGPFTFYFHRYENQPKHRTYLQIDGQFIRFSNPKMLTVQRSKLVPKGKIKVLRNAKIQ